MKFSVIVPCFQAESFLSACLDSILAQREEGIDLEVLVMDGASQDGTLQILESYGDQIRWVSEPDKGPTDAINKGFAQAQGDVLSWLNADDLYQAHALAAVRELLERRPEASFVFGRCPIIDLEGKEIRQGITRFKEFFFPCSSRFTFQCINYISQPSCFFRASALREAGPLRLDLKAAWDYEFLLRMWRQGPGLEVKGNPLASFCWHEGSISGQHFQQQFAEEFDTARADAGSFSLQTLIHWFVKWGIIGAYSLMQKRRKT